MILAHHLGENFIPALVAGGAGSDSVLLAIGRARIGRLVERLRRR
jgi:hypothetical protein